MVTLLNLVDIKNPRWYFEDAWFDYTNNGSYKYSWPNPSFPFHASIHYDDLEDNKIKIEIRKWIELNIQDTVILDYIDKSYRKYYGESHDWHSSYEVSNKWMVFYFEDEHSALAFRLRFSNLITEVTNKHPKKDNE